MSEEAATPTGGAEVSARPESQPDRPLSITDRIKASLMADTPEPKREQAIMPPAVEAPEKVSKAPPQEKPKEVEEEAPPEIEAEEQMLDAAQLRSIKELAEATGLDLDKILDLDIPTKIDGKEGAARLRDMVKSYQLEGHLNQKLMTHAEEKKAFEAERQTLAQQHQHRMLQLDAATQVAQRLLDGEFAGVNWQQLQLSDPHTFNQKYVEYQQRQQALNYLADQIGQERQKQTATQETANKAYLAEQTKLLESKLPEWADKAVRSKEISEMSSALQEAYGVTDAELKARTDHREVLIMRDAWKWQQLQKSKPAIVNKVKAAPKLLKPGTPQSREAQNQLQVKADRDRLRKSGSIQDAKALLKRQLFN